MNVTASWLINNPLANIISTEEHETEVYHIENTLGSRIVAEIPDIQSIMDSIDAIKDDWTVREKAIPKDSKILSKELDNFNDVLDEYAENGDIESVKTAWNTKIKTAYNVVKCHLEEITDYDDDTLQADSDGKKIDIERKKATSNIEKVKIKYECANGVYRQTIMSNRQNVEKNSNRKPETVPFQMFNPETVNYVKWEQGVREFVKNMKDDNAKQNFLIGKLPTHIQTQLQNHQSFEDCMLTLAHQFGDHVKNTTEQIARYVKWALEPPASIHQADKIRVDIANISGFTARLVNPRDRACKCPDSEKKACALNGHKPQDHCNRHCEFTVYKEDSDRLHSILMALAANRLPGQIVLHVGGKARDKEKADGRIMDVKEFVNMLSEYVNNLQISRVTMRNQPQPNNFVRQSGYNRTIPRKENALVAQDEDSLDESDKPGRNKSEKSCLYCMGPHWITDCSDVKQTPVENILRKIKDHKGCTICLKRGHNSRDCHNKGKQLCYYCKDNKIRGHQTHKKLVCPKKPEPTYKENTLVANEDESEDEPQLPEMFFD